MLAVSKIKVIRLYIAMTAREFATSSLKGAEIENMGVQGYTVRKTVEMDKPRITVFKPSKKSTFLDEVIRMKRHVPDADYEVTSDIKEKDTRSGLPKGQRSLLSDEIANQARRSPQPDFGTYKPLYSITEKR